ncbi:hypothetical protein O4J55_23190 [Paracoccus sp. PXZ]
MPLVHIAGKLGFLDRTFLKQQEVDSSRTNSSPQHNEITAQARTLIADIYAADFKRFGYSSQLGSPEDTGTAASEGNRT